MLTASGEGFLCRQPVRRAGRAKCNPRPRRTHSFVDHLPTPIPMPTPASTNHATVATKPTPILPEEIMANLNTLDDLVQSLGRSQPATKPWARRLREHLREADRCIEVLRLTLLLGQPLDEIAASASQVRAVSAAMEATATGGRADLTTRSALLLIHRLAQSVDRHFHAMLQVSTQNSAN